MIPFLDLKAAYLELKDELDDAFQRVMSSGWYILGEEVEAFEDEFAAYCGVKYCVGVSNGLDALRLALEAYEIGAGDEVIVPSQTFIATWLAVSHSGATPVPVEPDIETYNIDPRLIEAAITEKTRAIIPVHLYGQPADMEPIMRLAAASDLVVIEDAAQAHGASYHNRKTGSLGHAAAFSFYPAKNLGAFGDGGAITVNDSEIASRLRTLRNYGSKEKYLHLTRGANARLDELQAAFLRVKLKKLDEWNLIRSGLADYYLGAMANFHSLQLPKVLKEASPVWHLFVVRHDERDSLFEFLKGNGVGAQVHYPIPPHRSAAYVDALEESTLEIATELCDSVLSLPMGPQLSMSRAETVVQRISEFCD